ncbi:MAG: prepilin-type N-terminal cleavage/methylation domain-containing protein [Planctomycetes bacterium]|nr:prepilin-type N-terminal cleavage/methylation domain-containing protein [Planctomycetota bacterium]
MTQLIGTESFSNKRANPPSQDRRDLSLPRGPSAFRPVALSSPAFTLIELLVVIGIISLLLAILLPAMSAARQTAQGSACMSNLRRLGISCMMYLESRTAATRRCGSQPSTVRPS